MTAPTGSSIPTKVLSIDHTSFVFSFIFFHFIIDNCNYRSLFRKSIKMKIFILFTVVYPKINMNVVKTKTCRRTLEKMQISLGNCRDEFRRLMFQPSITSINLSFSCFGYW